MFPYVRPKARSSNCDLPAPEVSELSRHLLRAQEKERKRISRELHDGTGQSLMVLRLYLAMLASDGQSPESRAKIQEALQLLDHTVEDLRRIISRLSPRVLDELGLLAAIRKEVLELAKSAGMRFELDLPERIDTLDHESEIALYRSLQEALHNIAKHSQAQCFSVRLKSNGNSLCLLVEDNGLGMSGSSLRLGDAFGLRGMRERIAALGGTVQVRSRPDNGVCLKVSLPIGPQEIRRHAVGERGRMPVKPPARTGVTSTQRQRPLAFAAKT